MTKMFEERVRAARELGGDHPACTFPSLSLQLGIKIKSSNAFS